MYYDRDGNQIDDLMEWAKLFEDPAYQRVAEDTVGDVWVSTLWIGWDKGYGDGAPILFETMAFRGGADVLCERYATFEEAQEGHRLAVERVRKGDLDEL